MKKPVENILTDLSINGRDDLNRGLRVAFYQFVKMVLANMDWKVALYQVFDCSIDL